MTPNHGGTVNLLKRYRAMQYDRDRFEQALRDIVERAEKPCGVHEAPLPYDVAWAEQVAIAKAALCPTEGTHDG